MIFDLCHGCRNDARLHDPLDTLGEALSVGSLTGTTIDRVDVLVLRHALSRTRCFSTGSNVTRDSVVVRMSDRASRVGWGETYLVPGAVSAARAMTAGLPGLTPMPTDDLATYARLAGELDIPIAGGESVETFDAASAAVAAGAYDIIQPDASICGGVGTLLPRSRYCRSCPSTGRSRVGCRRCWNTTWARTRSDRTCCATP